MKFSFPQMASMLMNVGDVIPFRRQSIEPGMGLTEGARPNIGGGGGYNPVTGKPIGGMPLNQWLYQNNVPMNKIGQLLELQKQHGLSDDAIKYQTLLAQQQQGK